MLRLCVLGHSFSFDRETVRPAVGSHTLGAQIVTDNKHLLVMWSLLDHCSVLEEAGTFMKVV